MRDKWEVRPYVCQHDATQGAHDIDDESNELEAHVISDARGGEDPGLTIALEETHPWLSWCGAALRNWCNKYVQGVHEAERGLTRRDLFPRKPLRVSEIIPLSSQYPLISMAAKGV